MSSKPDIWMPLYIGDYLADTAHLDAEQSGCYLHWLMHYWRRGPLVDSVPELVKIGKLRSSDAPSIAQALLNEFFSLGLDQRWHQKRIDEELAAWAGKSIKAKEKAKRAAKVRWEKDAPSNATSNARSNAWSTPQAMLEQCPSPSPLPIKDRVPKGTHSEFVEAWNDNCGKLPAISKFSSDRQRKLEARIRSGLTLEEFVKAVQKCVSTGWLNGSGERGWQATFDWLIAKDSNVARVLEGSYGNGEIRANTRPASQVGVYEPEESDKFLKAEGFVKRTYGGELSPATIEKADRDGFLKIFDVLPDQLLERLSTPIVTAGAA